MTRTIVVFFASWLAVAAPAMADWTANVGWASDYYFRGIKQHSSSFAAGIDFEHKGAYAGAWSADVGDGLEIDGYFGYRREIGDFSYGVGFTGYYYSSNFYDTYQEINLGSAYKFLTLDVAVGQYDNFSGPTLDYTHVALTLEKNGFYGTYGTFKQDFSGSYLQTGYGAGIAGFDLGLSVLHSDSDLIGDADTALIFTIGRTFDLN